MSTSVSGLLKSFDIYTYIYISTIIVVVIYCYFSTESANRTNLYPFISLIVCILSLILLSENFIWIITSILLLVLYYIFHSPIFEPIFIIDEDVLFLDKETQIWERFNSPPELKNSGKIKEETS